MVFDFAGGPLAVVLQFRLAAQHPVLGPFQVGAQLLQQVGLLARRVAERFGRLAVGLSAGGSRLSRSLIVLVRRLVFRHVNFSGRATAPG